MGTISWIPKGKFKGNWSKFGSRAWKYENVFVNYHFLCFLEVRIGDPWSDCGQMTIPIANF